MKWLWIILLLFPAINVNAFAFANISHSCIPGEKAVVADCPNIDDSHILIAPSSCSVADGSITGITTSGVVTGNAIFTWYDENNKVLSNAADLLNVSPGTYLLTMHDQGKCLGHSKKYIVGEKSNVNIDTSEMQIKSSGCSVQDGYIVGISATNVVQVQWFNNGVLVAGTLDIKNIPSGLYSLVITGTNGCTTQRNFLVPAKALFPQVARIDTLQGQCNYSASSLVLSFNLSPSSPAYTYMFTDSLGNLIINEQGLPYSGPLVYDPGGPSKISITTDAPNTPYYLVLYTADHCSALIGKYSLPAPGFSIVTTNPFFLVRNDACGRHTGGIFNLKVMGGTRPETYFGNPPPQYWTWTDSAGNVLNHFPDLTSVGKGAYTVTVVDVHGCSDTKAFTIADSTAEALPPALNGTTLCLPGTTSLSVINPVADFKYRLYDSAKTVLTENSYGIFQQKVTRTTRYYATTINGLCESDYTPVTVIVIAPGVIIPNTFTPNNDGINDYWDIPHIDEFPGAEVSVFNRDGQTVYHSINYSHPFNGNYNGSRLPSGVYYYIIDLKQPECLGKVSGSLTLIR